MEVKPGYRKTELGVIPEEWEVKPLLDLSSDIGDGIHATPNYVNSSDFHFVNGNNLVNDRIAITESTMCVSEAEYKKLRKNLIDRTLLLSINGTIGNLAFFNGERVVLGKSAAYINLATGVSRRFVAYCLKNRPTALYFDSELTGTTIRNLSLQSLRNTPIPLPPTAEEQRAIATALSDVDGLLGGLDRLIAKKRDLKQAAMQQLLTGQTRLLGFDGDWEVKPLRDVIHLIPSGIYGEEKPRVGLIAASVATTAHIDEDDTWNNKEMPVRYFTAEKLREYATAAGDLIVVKSSGSAASIQSGKLGFIDSERAEKFVFSNFLMLLRPTGILPSFLYFYLCSHGAKKLLPTLVEASTYPNIRLGDYLAVEIPVPSSPEQTAVAEVLTDMDAELAVLEQRREKTRALKQAMMQELLTGRTRLVSHKDAHA